MRAGPWPGARPGCAPHPSLRERPGGQARGCAACVLGDGGAEHPQVRGVLMRTGTVLCVNILVGKHEVKTFPLFAKLFVECRLQLWLNFF